MRIPEGVDERALAAVLQAALAWSGPRARGDVFVEESSRVTFERADRKILPPRGRSGRGAAIRTWTADGVRFAAADGEPGRALAGCLKQIGVPASQAAIGGTGTTHVKEDGSGPAPGQGGGPVEAYLARLEGAIAPARPAARLRIALSSTHRRTAVSHDGGGLAASEWFWLRLSVEATLDGRRVRWSGGARTLSELDKRFSTARVAAEMARRMQGIDERDTPECVPETPVLLAAGAGALVLHELVHALEADTAQRDWSCWTAEPGREQARTLSPLVTLWDDPSRAGLSGSFRQDDEGTAADRRMLVRRGRVINRLGDRRTAEAVAGVRPGNGRRPSWHEWPAPRASNLVMGGGTSDGDHLRRAKGMQLVVHDLEAGATDPLSGRFHVLVADGEWLDSGTRVARVAGLPLQGQVVDVAAGIDRVCNDAEADRGNLICSREGHGVPIGLFAPTFRVRGLSGVRVPS